MKNLGRSSWRLSRDDGTLDGITIELYELYNFLTCKEVYIKQSINASRKESLSYITNDIYKMSYNRAESLASRSSSIVSPLSKGKIDEDDKEDEEDGRSEKYNIQWNHIYQDKENFHFTQLQVRVSLYLFIYFYLISYF